MRYLYIFAILLISGCTYPKDPENSYQKARETSLKVGVVLNSPFTTYINDHAGGREVEMLKEFAKAEDLKIEFQEGSESDLVKKLEKYEIDLVAGGFDKKTLWKKKAGLTATYDKKHVFLVPKGENRLLQHLETFIFKNLEKR